MPVILCNVCLGLADLVLLRVINGILVSASVSWHFCDSLIAVRDCLLFYVECLEFDETFV